MTVRWNDGDVITEVQIPMLASGQRILIEHSSATGSIESIPTTRLVPPPPTVADDTLDAAYRARGLRVNPDAPEVSLATSRSLMQEAIASGNYAAWRWSGPS
jgi:hypothetical protein